MKRNSSRLKICLLTLPLISMSIQTKSSENITQELKLKRETNWKNYVKEGMYSLFIDSNKIPVHLSPSEKIQLLKQRNERWDQLLELYAEADYISVTEMAPSFNQWNTHRAAAAYLSGISYSKFNQLKNSLRDLNLAIKYKFKNPQVYFEKGKVLLSLDLLDESYSAFLESIKRNNQVVISKYYLGWIKELQKDYQAALKHYDELITDESIDSETNQSVQIRRAEIYQLLAQDSALDKRAINQILSQKVVLPSKQSISLDPSTTNAKRLREFLQKLEQKFGLPSLIPFKIGSMGNYLRLNQYLTYNTNVTSLPAELSQFRDSWLSNTIFVYKHILSSFKNFTHTPELRINYITHFEKNIPGIYSEDMYVIGPSLRNSFKHKVWNGNNSTFNFDVETSYTAKDTNHDHSNEFFSRAVKLNVGENLHLLPFGDTNIKFRQDFRNYYDSTLNTKTFTFFINQLMSLQNNRTVSLIINADLTTADTSINSINSYMLRVDYLHPNLIGKWELQTALSFLGTDTKEQSATRGFETNITYEMEWRRKFMQDFEFALNYNYSINNSKDEVNFSYDKHLISFEIQYIPKL